MSTETTNKKIKIDNGTTFGRTYTDKAVDELLKNIGGGGGGSSILRKDGTFVSKDEGVVANTISLSSAEYNRIKNGEINIIYGECKLDTNVVSNYKVVFDYINNGDMYNYEYTDVIVEDNRILISDYQLTITAESAFLAIMTTTQPRIPTLPTDASTKNYTLQAVNGVPTWNTTGGYVKIFQPHITNVSVTVFDDNKRIIV